MRNIKKISVIFLIILTLFGINLYSSDSGELKVKSAKIQFTRIKIMFNQAINPASINQDSLYLLGEEGKLERNVKLRARSRIMVIKLKKPFSLLKPLILI